MCRSSVWLLAALVVACVAVAGCSRACGASAAVITSVRGCALVAGNGTSGCNYNDTVLIYGSNLPTGNSISGYLTSATDTYLVSNVTSYNSSAMSARLPFTTVMTATSFWVQVQNSSVSSNSVYYVTYQSQQPYVYRVTGCPVTNYTGNSTSGCQQGMTVTIDGHHFAPPSVPSYLYAVIGSSMTAPCTFVSTSRVTCVLPSVAPYYSQWLSVQVFVVSLSSISRPLVHFTSPTPFITSIAGCAVQSWNAASGCNYNDTIFVYGTNLPTGASTSVSLSGSYYATNVTSYDGSVLSARLPYIGVSSITTYSVRVRNGTVATNAVNYVTYQSQYPSIDRITGCAVDDAAANSTAGCQPGTIVTIDGQHFAPAAVASTVYAFVGGAYIWNCTFISTTRITCTLPSIPAGSYNSWLVTFVQVGFLSSDWRQLVMYYALDTPLITSVRGCAVRSENETSGCNWNDTIVIQGSDLPTGDVTVTVLFPFPLGDHYYATNVTSYNSSALSARLPWAAITATATCYVQVQNSSVSSNSVYYVTYQSQQPYVYRVTGCPVTNYTGNSTSGCQQGMTVTIDGHHFAPTTSALYAGTGGQRTSTCTFIGTSRVTCVLPAISTGYNTWLWIYVQVGSLASSNLALLVSYSSPPASSSSSSSTGPFLISSSSTGTSPASPFIASVRGCAVVVGSGTSGCNYNDTVLIYGSNLPTTSGVSVRVSNNYYATDVVSYDSSTISARLPYAAVALPTTYAVQVWNSAVASNAVNYITYAPQSPYVYRVSGCTVNGAAGNGTSGCQQGMTVTIDGHHFLPSSDFRLLASVGGYWTNTCTCTSTSRVMCTLPSVPANLWAQWLSVQVQADSLYSINSPFYVMYGTPSSSSTGSIVIPAIPSSSKQNALTVIVLVVVAVVVGVLLLVCQVLYCLHHFAGFSFPRLARLTGGRLFAVAEAVEEAGVDLRLLAHDHQQHQPGMLQIGQPQPPRMAAAAYHPPSYYMPAPPPLPASDAPHRAAHPLLYPHSFVPSPHYHQPPPSSGM